MKHASSPYYPDRGRLEGLWKGSPASLGHPSGGGQVGISTVKDNGPSNSGRKSAVKPASPVKLAGVLQYIAKRMLPFYRKVASDGIYARRWSNAVVDTDLDQMDRLLKQASPNIGRHFLGSNGIGYFVDFRFAEPFRGYTNGTTIPPGTVQFVFEPQAHRALAAAVIPFYCSLAGNRKFAQAVAKAIEEDDPERLSMLVRSRVKSKSLKTVGIESTGLAMNFRFTFSKYPYRNLLIKDETA